MIEGLGVRIGPEAVVVVAAQPLRVLGWSIAQAARRALEVGIRGWQERNP